MIEFRDADTASVDYVADEWRLTVRDTQNGVLLEASLPWFAAEEFFLSTTAGRAAGLEYVGPFLNKRGLYYTQWTGRPREGWSTQLHY